MKKCAVTDGTEFEDIFGCEFPLWCGCTKAPQSDDIVARMDFCRHKV